MGVSPHSVWFLTFSVAMFCALMLVRWSTARPWLTRSDDDETPDLEAVMKLIVLLVVIAVFCYVLFAGHQAASTLG